MTRTEVIDLLLENQPTILMVVNRVDQRLITQDVNVFDEEIRDQWLDLVIGELVNELYNKGLTLAIVYDTIETEEFHLFLEELLRDE